MKSTRIVILNFVATVLFSSLGFAQDRSDFTFIANVKGHQFYDPGVYDISETSEAQTKGLGLYAQYLLSKKVSLTGGYGFAYVDGLKYNGNTTNKAAFHQLDLNIGYHFFQPHSSLRPYLFFGYSYNSIPQLASFNELTDGVNSNFGMGLRIKIIEGLSLDANTTYAFSYANQIRFNFRHQIGLALTPRALRQGQPTKTVPVDDTRYELLLSDNRALAVENDSLRKEVEFLSKVTNQKESSTLLVAYNNDLNEKIKRLEEDNQRLIDELRYRRYSMDSAINEKLVLYDVLDTAGRETEVTKEAYKKGYYLVRTGFKTQDRVESILKQSPFTSLDPIYLLTSLDEFHAIGWLSEDKSEAEEKLKAIDRGRKIYTIRQF